MTQTSADDKVRGEELGRGVCNDIEGKDRNVCMNNHTCLFIIEEGTEES